MDDGGLTICGVWFEGLMGWRAVAYAPVGQWGACLGRLAGDEASKPRRCAAGGNWRAGGFYGPLQYIHQIPGPPDTHRILPLEVFVLAPDSLVFE